MTAKRLFDFAFALVLLVPGLPAIAVIWAMVRLRDGRLPSTPRPGSA